MKIVIQAGHINCQNNSIVALRGNTGAPGEQELTLRIANRLSNLLRSKGFDVVQTDACANDDASITTKDFSLFLALHGDADYAGDNGGGFATFPEPSSDGATIESQRITKVINDVYFPETKIVYKDRANLNTKFYYMWKFLSAKTPCVLIEMGQVQDPHDKVLLGNTDLIANALGRSICKALNVPFDVTPAPVVDPRIKQLDDAGLNDAEKVRVAISRNSEWGRMEEEKAILEDQLKDLGNKYVTLKDKIRVSVNKAIDDTN